MAWLRHHRGKLLALGVSLMLLPLAEPPATAMGQRPRPADAHYAKSPTDPESLLVQSRLDSALKHIETLITLTPNFQLAHLIRGDLLMARARPLHTLGSVAHIPPDRLNDFREEARARLRHHLDPAPLDRLPAYLLQFDPRQRHAVVVDTNKSRLYLYRNRDGVPEYVTDYYITVGKRGAEKLREGDQRTPIGVYFVVDDLPKSKLTDFYGSGAYPIDYPNAWDRRLGRNGYGIWLHGVPRDTYSRPPRASNGCVVLSNEDLTRLAQYLEVGHTPVVISQNIAWIDRKTWQAQRAALAQAVEAWRRSWESLDVERYLAHYAPDFSNGTQDYAAWAAQKRAVAAGKTSIEVKLENLSIFRDPGQDDLVVVTFDQDYRSNNLTHQMRKRQYWQRQENGWRIVYEGAA